ncbi:NACHT domain-containing protein [Micromonospora palythoicola]|uniref:NACHT domain-containing protein n=1 Tax=Micromonospora palythoicola TaxID=3120507 RepID=UPI002FCE65A4
MTQQYENLLDEHFQMLCQAVLVKVYPTMQCLPVGMPDGGRDAFVLDPHQKDLLIFQVKYARAPHSLDDPVAWIEKAVRGELHKIQVLARRGATQYCLVTNVSGTSHLDSGRIDRVQKFLDETLPMPGWCLWREDLDRRLEGDFDLKLAYPGILTGADIPRLLWQQASSSGNSERRTAALRAYLSYQYEHDATVRFKQADLPPSDLFDLYIDVPAQLASTKFKNRASILRVYGEAVRRILVSGSTDSSDAELHDSDDNKGPHFAYQDGVLFIRVGNGGYAPTQGAPAAQLLSDRAFASELPYIVLEGAPGQGKSTLTQYLAQIHRARYLGRDDLTGVPDSLRMAPLALPFRIELRDFAEWLSGKNPWAKEPNTLHNMPLSLEAAIAGQVERYSGGLTFNVDDLHSIAQATPLLLLLDGLDEVADLDTRRNVVDLAMEGIHRLTGIARRLSVLVTTRPTAITNSPNFPKDRFATLTLAPIDSQLALAYTDKWAKARNLRAKDKNEVKTILTAKMSSAHMADLAKNTMQLSILLSLIYLRGASLPDKRTELYFTYIETFMNRESEKSEIVRQNRTLLIDLHCYLGYYLHGMAERSGTNGRIRVSELTRVLADYLAREGRPAQLIDELVIGTVERVVALVSRVEGTYEFEVQPLREYFAARFLYETASYSPTGRESSGTKPDRFDALARRAYWQNVTRFFAGSFSKGELLDLSERVSALIGDASFRYSMYPRNLALALLQDWVFTQSVRATGEVVDSVFDDFGLRWSAIIEPGPSQVRLDESFRLTEDSGSERLVALLWDRLRRGDRLTDVTEGLCRLLARNASTYEIESRWRSELTRRKGERRSIWLQIGSRLGLTPLLQSDDLLPPGENVDDRQRANRLALAVSSAMPLNRLRPEDRNEGILRILKQPVGIPRILKRTLGSDFAVLTSPFRWAMKPTNFPSYYYDVQVEELNDADSDLTDPMLKKVAEFNSLAVRLWAEEMRSDLGPWIDLVRALESISGVTNVSTELSVIAAGISSRTERGAGVKELFEGAPMPMRVRNARYRASQTHWWASQAAEARSKSDAVLWLISLLSWAGPGTIASLLSEIGRFAKQIDDVDLHFVHQASRRARRYSARARRPITLDQLGSHLERLPTQCLALIADRMPPELPKGKVMSRLRGKAKHPWATAALMEVALSEFSRSRLTNKEILEVARLCFQRRGYVNVRDVSMSILKARESVMTVLSDPWNYPDDLVMGALFSLRNQPKERPLMEVADQDSWFGAIGRS